MSIGHASSQNHKAQLANAYNELGKELSSKKIKVVGNYNLGRAIGEGAYGKVRMGTHRLTAGRVAIKQIPKAMSAQLTREIHHHRQLHHPHIMQMYEVIATESSIWIVTELCSGGELYDFLVEKGRLAEDETRVIFGQLCLAVAYLHNKGIVHRDLKLENVLLDEKCRVKLGDFGFTREYERGCLLETFCGTTGYAAPEMLQSRRYTGPEVDVWSLGIILYCLLTGALPFDDDDEGIMKQKIIEGQFEDPDWLSDDARDLIQNILRPDPATRLQIPQILSHSWFTSPQPLRPPSALSNVQHSPQSRRSVSPVRPPAPANVPSSPPDATVSSITSSDDATFPPDVEVSPPTTPDHRDPPAPFKEVDERSMTHSNSSEATLHNSNAPKTPVSKHVTPPVIEEELEDPTPRRPPLSRNGSTSSAKIPPAPLRTPARTKRRSVSSALSDPDSPSNADPFLPLPPQDFGNLLKTPAPVIFSTVLERDLLSNLSGLGFDTGQMVHSVLSNACDASSAIWWMVKRRAERTALEEKMSTRAMIGIAESEEENEDVQKEREKSRRKLIGSSNPRYESASVQTENALILPMLTTTSAPELAFVPPTPTITSAPYSVVSNAPGQLTISLSSPSAAFAEQAILSAKSAPGTPLKEGRKNKPRSGSVSIMQRATTALEAAGIVRKKSNETVTLLHNLEMSVNAEGSYSSHGGGSTSRSVHSPSLSQMYGSSASVNTPNKESMDPSSVIMGPPWLSANEGPSSSITPPDQDTLTSLPDFSSPANRGLKNTLGPRRNRASLLTALRLWFNEDRKGKRKANPNNQNPAMSPSRTMIISSVPIGTVRSRNGSLRQRRGNSKRSSSVNSRRSSGQSFRTYTNVESPQGLSDSQSGIRSRTPPLDRADQISRPSSVASAVRNRHRKSPSASSNGSFRTASPYHRRQGSGSSARVIRQSNGPSRKLKHGRANSTASSIHSVASSRPASFYEETDGSRAGSPHKTPKRRVGPSSSSFASHKRQTPFGSPGPFAASRSSWKKSWGLEPPGWQTRSTHAPVEVLSISPPGNDGNSIRDVFTGRMSFGDDSDWIDEDEEVPAFAGGLGQTASSASPPLTEPTQEAKTFTLTKLVLPPIGRRSKGAGKHSPTKTTMGGVGASVSKRKNRAPAPEPIVAVPSEVAAGADEGRSSRWQNHGRSALASRSNPLPIQEEDEDEEEEDEDEEDET